MKYKPVRYLLLISTVLFALLSCEELERDNPRDLGYSLKPPTLITVLPVSDTRMVVTWKSSEEGAEEFIIKRKTASESYNKIGTTIKDNMVFIDSSCTLGVQYEYVVQSQVGLNLSEDSNPIIGVTSFPAPTELLVTAISDISRQISWTDNCDFERGYKIERGSGYGFEQIAVVDANLTNYVDSNLDYYSEYIYRVAAYTLYNVTSWVISSEVSTGFPAPSGLATSMISSTQIQLNWTDNSGKEDGFVIERNSGQGFNQIDEVNSNITSYEDDVLVTGRTYDYRVRAYTDVDSSEYSSTSSIILPLTDIDGNEYEIIQIGDQVWMAENLMVSKFQNGDEIIDLTDDTTWIVTETSAYCSYSDIDTYGYLYNWYAVYDLRSISPNGWHIPTDEEWKELEMYLGMTRNEVDKLYSRGTNEGGKLKETGIEHWAAPNAGATNSSGFTALPVGYCDSNQGVHYNETWYGYFWTSSEYSAQEAWYRVLSSQESDIRRVYVPKKSGYSIRCIRD